jgi:hypothetical protein
VFLEPPLRLGVVEDLLERSVLESRPVDVSGDPAVMEERDASTKHNSGLQNGYPQHLLVIEYRGALVDTM